MLRHDNALLNECCNTNAVLSMRFECEDSIAILMQCYKGQYCNADANFFECGDCTTILMQNVKSIQVASLMNHY